MAIRDRISAPGPWLGATALLLVAICALLAPPAGADSVSLASAPAFRLDAASYADYVGYSTDGIGDFNGDGHADVAIGAPQLFNPSPTSAAGIVYIVFGPRSPARIKPPSLGASAVEVTGAPGDWLGFAVSGAGDVNRDGYSDLLVVAGELGGYDDAYVIFGSAHPTHSIDVHALGVSGFKMERGFGLGFYDSLGAADVNDDGYSDVIMGANLTANNLRTQSGSVYVVYGSPDPEDVDLTDLKGQGFRVDGASPYDELTSVGGAGDVNNDGYEDIVVGALYADNDGREDSGSAYVIYGGSSLDDIDLASLGGAGFRIDGDSAGGWLGSSVEGAGDLNDDTYDDLIVGAPNAGAGSAFVIYGAPSHGNLEVDSLAPSVGVRIVGAGLNQSLGESVDSAGDVNGDGNPDVIVGAPCVSGCSAGSTDAAYVIFGGSLPSVVEVANLGSAGIEFTDPGPDEFDTQDKVGQSVSGAGNFDADPADEILIGEILTDNGNSTGSAFVVLDPENCPGLLSCPPTPSGMSTPGSIVEPERRVRPRSPRCAHKRITIRGTVKRDILTGSRRRDVIAGFGGKDVIRGLGGDDLICGGGGDDSLFGGPGADVLIGGPGYDTLRGGTDRDVERR